MSEDVKVKIGTNTEKVRQDTDKTAKSVGKSLSNAFTQVVTKLGSGVLLAQTISQELHKGAEEYSRLIAKSKEIATQADVGHVSQARTAERLGLGGSMLATIASASGSTTEEQRTAFAAGLSEDDSREDNRKAIALQATGLYEDGEIKKAMKEGRLDELRSGMDKRRSMLGPEYGDAVRKADQDRSQSADLRAIANREATKLRSDYDLSQEKSRIESPFSAVISDLAPNISEAIYKLIGATESNTAEMARQRRGKPNTNLAQDSQ